MQDLQQTIQLVLDYVRGIWVKKRYLIVCSWLICPLGFIYVANMPDVYESEAQVFVDTRSMLQNTLVGMAMFTDPEQEVRVMANTLKSRTNLEKIAREADLDIQVTTDEGYENLIASLDDNIKMNSTGRSNIYTISYISEKPDDTKRVVQETLDLFVEGSLGGNRRDSDNTNRFLDEQIAEFEARLAEAEQQRAEFQRKYSEILPLQGTFHNNLQNITNQLAETRLLIRETEQQSNTLKSRLTRDRKASDGFDVQGGNSAPVITTRYDARIISLEEKLDALKLRFTEQHPDVIESQALLDSLQASREKEIEAYMNQDNDDDSPMMSQLNQEISLEISRLEGKIASLRVREANFVAKIEDLRTKIDLVPQIEAEGISKNRNYNIVKQKYEELLARKEAANLTRSAEISSDDLQFRIIKPPLVPMAPSGPNRILFYTGILVLGFGTGIALAFLMSQVKPILVRGQQLTNITGYPIWGVVTHLDLDKIRRKNKFRMAFFVISTGAIIFMYGILIAADIMNVDLLSKVL